MRGRYPRHYAAIFAVPASGNVAVNVRRDAPGSPSNCQPLL